MTEQDFLIRILLSMLCGGLLGLDRQIKRHPAGLRTLILVCMGATLIVMTDSFLRETFKTQDSFRLSAQVVNGVGFIGAGAIIQSRASVKGLTTAATLWFTAAVGLAIGAGYYIGAVGSTVLALIVLAVLPWAERRLPVEEKSESES